MNNIKKFDEFLNENIKDLMVGKSEEEVEDAVKNMSFGERYLNINVPKEYKPTQQEFEDYIEKNADIINNDHLDDAMCELQSIIGIDDGGICGMYFSQFDDADEHWKNATIEKRKEMIDEYIDDERRD